MAHIGTHSNISPSDCSLNFFSLLKFKFYMVHRVLISCSSRVIACVSFFLVLISNQCTCIAWKQTYLWVPLLAVLGSNTVLFANIPHSNAKGARRGSQFPCTPSVVANCLYLVPKHIPSGFNQTNQPKKPNTQLLTDNFFAVYFFWKNFNKNITFFENLKYCGSKNYFILIIKEESSCMISIDAFLAKHMKMFF